MRGAFAAAVLALAACDERSVSPPVRATPGPDAIVMRIDSDPPGADAIVDGTRVGATPCSAPLEPGRHRVVVRKPGYMPSVGELDVRAGGPRSYKAMLIASH